MSAGLPELRTQPLPDGRGLRTTLVRGAGLLTWDEVLGRLHGDERFVDAFTTALARAPYAAFLWETPPVSAATRATPFEWVLTPSALLATVDADDGPFAQHVRGERGIRTFENLGGDARLVVPCAPGSDPRPASHAHLAAFVRGAPRQQIHALWAETARAVETRLAASPAPCWVSTSGLGVFWVHVRIDERPKYYAHGPYRRGS